ncbi:MAG: Thioredoxin [uncultured Thiotrichaceae bacterium]|uniref:Thioredoxin n=1 Tax=uncultured Thiotrichaceae bacterium TaxID=298394 RepID=A0A6S6U934_9GAMM|nr:MAG: Thioredoxin [uncultured Thiotrichaceae bacterium]
MSKTTLYYVHDPMCSWCWGFRKTWQQVKQQLPAEIELQYLLGGLASDSEVAMPQELQTTLQQTWQQIQQRIPGTEFNFDFWTDCKPRRSTYPACRAVIAAQSQGAEFEEAMILAIQEAYYLHAQNPSDDDTLIQLARDLKVDIKTFTTDLNAEQTQATLKQEMQQGQSIGARGFPSVVMEQNNQLTQIAIDYNNPEAILQQIDSAIHR